MLICATLLHLSRRAFSSTMQHVAEWFQRFTLARQSRAEQRNQNQMLCCVLSNQAFA